MILKRGALIAVVAYTILSGVTFDGIVSPQRRLIDVLLVGLLTILWIVARRRWRWHRTPLDWAILLWAAAFALSLFVNLDSWRRIAIGLWFMGVYVGVWYLFQDAFANHALKREWLVDALLIAGVPIVFVGFAQVEVALTSGLSLPRPVGTLGNANALAAFLVMLVPFAAGRFATARAPLARVLYAFYCVAALVLIVLTFSRGGWIGVAAALAVWIILTYPVRRTWSGLPRAGQIALAATFALAVLIGGYVIVQSFGIGGRGLELRAWLYETALQLFAERPVTGYGLFTFGAGLSRLNSLPPLEPHSHAHNVILHVAAELGIVGLAALALTAWLIFHVSRHPVDRTAVMGAAAFAGFVAHQMFDLPAMMPALALTALASLVLALPMTTPTPRGRWQPILLAVGGLALTILGLWEALNYSNYVSILSAGIASGDYRATADRLQPLADADPMLAVYPQEQGMLLGFAAAEGDASAIQNAIERFRRYTTLEPQYATGWANLAALYAAAGEKTPAFDAMRHAAALAPRSWSLVYRLGVYAEAAGDAAVAQNAYQQAVTLNPDVVLLPEWDQSPLRQIIETDEAQLSVTPRTVLALERGEVETARRIWDESGAPSGDYSNNHVVNMLFDLVDGNLAQARAEWQAARRVAADQNARVWTAFGAAFLDGTDFDQQIDAARSTVEGSIVSNDWELGANINYIQFLRLAVPRQFLPQVGYTEVDPILLHLIGEHDTLTRLRAVVAG